MTTDDAIGQYHAILARDGLAAETAGQLTDELDRRKLLFGNRPLCSVLRPRFLSANRARLLRTQSFLVSTALQRMQEVAIHNSEILKQFRLLPWEEKMLPIPSRIRHPSPVSRLDGFFTAEGRLRFTEMNAQSPAGAGFSDLIAEVFLNLPAMQEFIRKIPVRTLTARRGTLAALREAWHDWSGSDSDPPQIAIVDWTDVPTRIDFQFLREEFEREGIPTRILSPLDLEFDGEQLSAAGEPIHLVYRRVLMVELIDRCGYEHPLIQAARAESVCIVNPISCRLPGKKASFAFLNDEANAHYFTGEEQRAIREHIPWTRFLEERQTIYSGQVIDLIPYVLKHKERFVLKPNDAYGGRSVVLGWTISDSAWQTAVTAGLAVPTIVQERIELPVEPYPVLVQGSLEFEPRWEDTCPFVGPDHEMFGCLTRLSTEPLVNVSAGGGAMVPTFIIDD